jgi:hypothetical protein
MKKYLFLLVVCTYLSVSALAQVPRTILFEEYTGENCPPCAQANPPLNALIHTTGNSPQKIVKVSWSVPIPSGTGLGPKSEFIQDSSEIIKRMYYYFSPYGTPEAPYTRFNGIELPQQLPDPNGIYYPGSPYLLNQTMINDSSINNAPFALSVTHTLNPTGDSVTVNCVVTAAQSYTAGYNGSLKLYIAMEEALITYTTAPGSNGEKTFSDVMRKMVPTTSGTVLNNIWSNTNSQTKTIKVKIPSYIFDKSQIAFAVWVADDKPIFLGTLDLGTLISGGEAIDTSYAKRVHQAAYSPAQTLAIDAAIPTVTLTPIAATCSDTHNLSMTLQNRGLHTITTCSVNYKLDNNAVQTQTWSGSLATGQTSTVTFLTFSVSPGSHTLLCYSSNPNDSLDIQAQNDTVRINFNVVLPANVPVIEGFETTNSLPNSIWNISHTSTGLDFTVTSNAAATGSKSVMLDNMSNAGGNNSILQTAAIYDLSMLASPTLLFKAAYQQKATTNADKLQIYSSTDCGFSWQSRKVIASSALASLSGGVGTAAYTPTAAQFTTYTVNINAVASSHNAMFRWEFYADPNGPGNNLYIDDINIASSVTGIENIETLVNLNLYPNPSEGKINIDFNLSEQHTIAVNITDLLGRVVDIVNTKLYHVGETSLTIGADNTYKAGIYLVNIDIDGQRISKKVLIQ